MASRSGQVLIAEYNRLLRQLRRLSATATADTTLYAHMKKLGTKAGATVKQGDTIGYVGTTGGFDGQSPPL
jgi:hypothetical protein